MLRLRNLVEIKQFITTSTSITVIFSDMFDAGRYQRMYGGVSVTPYATRFTMKEFDNLF